MSTALVLPIVKLLYSCRETREAAFTIASRSFTFLAKNVWNWHTTHTYSVDWSRETTWNYGEHLQLTLMVRTLKYCEILIKNNALLLLLAKLVTGCVVAHWVTLLIGIVLQKANEEGAPETGAETFNFQRLCRCLLNLVHNPISWSNS